MDKVLEFVAAGKDLEGIMLSEINQRKANTLWCLLYVDSKEKKKKKKKKNKRKQKKRNEKKQVHRYRKQIGACQAKWVKVSNVIHFQL